MGSRLSFSRSDGTSVNPTLQHPPPHHHLAAHNRSVGETRIRSHSHLPSNAPSDQASSSSRSQMQRRGSDGLTDDAAASLTNLNRLMSDFEASGIAADDPHLLRLLRHYRLDNMDRGRSGSLVQNASGAGAEGRRSNRHRRVRTVSSADATSPGDVAASRHAVIRQALFQLAAASSSAPSSRQRPWPEGLLLLDGRPTVLFSNFMNMLRVNPLCN